MHPLLPDTLPIDTAAADPAKRVTWENVPAKMAVYLLCAPEEGAVKPVLLATVGNLRAALQRRLTDLPPDQKTKRIAYGQLCTQVCFRIVHSPLLAHYYYWAVAKDVFPERYKEMLGWRPAWWINIDPHDRFPRFRRTQDLALDDSRFFGPIPERTASGKLTETLEDLFDLCRYYEILRQAPLGKACAYKEMGKCPAPCDGSIPLTQYAAQIQNATDYLTPAGYNAWRQQVESQMKAAAAKLDFEAAGRIKNKLQRGALVTTEPFAHMRELRQFQYLSLQPGKGKPWIEPLIISGSDIRALDPIQKKNLPTAAEALLAECQKAAQQPVTQADAEVIGLLSRHLARGEDDAGVYRPLSEIHTVEDILRAAEALAAKKNVRPMPDRASDETAPDAPATGEDSLAAPAVSAAQTPADALMSGTNPAAGSAPADP